MRLDTLVTQKFPEIESRAKIQVLIKSGKVLVENKVCKKPSFACTGEEKISISNPKLYVSRSALKLKAGLEKWKISVKNKICMDLGSSTGGFMEVLLEKGAKKIYGIENGVDQLHDSLQQNEKIKNFEKINAKEIPENLWDEEIEFFCADLSFISLTQIIPNISHLLAKDAQGVLLCKPQFEVDPKFVSEKGIVKNAKARHSALDRIKDISQNNGFHFNGYCESPIKGTGGNIEYLVWITRKV